MTYMRSPFSSMWIFSSEKRWYPLPYAFQVVTISVRCPVFFQYLNNSLVHDSGGQIYIPVATYFQLVECRIGEKFSRTMNFYVARATILCACEPPVSRISFPIESVCKYVTR